MLHSALYFRDYNHIIPQNSYKMNGPNTEKIEQMFNSIAADYDKLNHILSFGTDRSWRKKALKEIIVRDARQEILDIACGTGDFSIEMATHSNPETVITGLDLSEGMLSVMRDKVERSGLADRIAIQKGNCEKMVFDDNSFDRVTIGFGIRNFEHREKALEEILRVLRPSGRLVILELSVPSIPVIKSLYKSYFLHVLPFIGGVISGDKGAYRYLPASVLKFPGRDEWMQTMSNCGYMNVRHKALSFGICRMYTGEKLL